MGNQKTVALAPLFVLIFLVLSTFFKYRLGYFEDFGYNLILLAGIGIALTALSFGIFINAIIFFSKDVKKGALILTAYIVTEFLLVAFAERYFQIELHLPFQSIRSILLENEAYHDVWTNSPVKLFFILVYPIGLASVSYYSFQRSDLPAL